MQWPELVLALQGKEEELQNVRDQLQQAQEERDGHVKTISNLKQVCGISVVPDTGMAHTCPMRRGRVAGYAVGICANSCLAVPSQTTGGKGHSGRAADPGKERQCCGKLARPVTFALSLWAP